jgi:hypothetical protein
MHRIRWAMAEDHSASPKMDGIVEADETFVGGKPRNRGAKPGPRKDAKTPVVALVERGGSIRSFVTAEVTAANIGKVLRENVSL